LELESATALAALSELVLRMAYLSLLALEWE
jgi:hypothetical protein